MLAGFAGTLPVYAAENGASQPSASETLERLRRLKEENPQEFHRLVKERKAQIKSKVREFKQNNPEKFEGFRKQVSENRVQRLRKMKRENPEGFHRDMQGRAQRFEKMKRENPERFQKFIEKHPRFNEHMNKSSFTRGGGQPGSGQFRGRSNQLGQPGQSSQPGNFEGRKENLRQEGPRGGEFKNPGAGQNDSQFVSRPDFKRNGAEHTGQSERNFQQSGPNFNGQNRPQFNSQPSNDQDPGRFQNTGYNRPFEGGNRAASQNGNFQRNENGPGPAQNFRPQPGGVTRGGGQQQFGGARRPAHGDGSFGGGPGGGPRRRDR